MPLNFEEKSARASMTPEARRGQDLFRIAEALESIEEHLGRISERLYQRQHPHQD